MKHTLRYFLPAAAAIALALTACDSNADDNYQPGQPTDPNCPAVYICADNEADILRTPDDEFTSFDIRFARLKTDQAIDIPVNVTSPGDFFQFPATVSFAAGEAETVMHVAVVGDVPRSTKLSYTLKLDPKNVDLYAATNGGSTFTGSVLIADWKPFLQNVPFVPSNIYTQTVYSDIYKLEGANKFRIENFINSGITLYFSMAHNRYDGWIYTMEPYGDNCYYDPEGTAWNSWYLCDNGNWPTFNLEDGSTDCNYIYFYGWEDTYYYSYFKPEDGEGVFYGQFQFGDDYEYILWNFTFPPMPSGWNPEK